MVATWRTGNGRHLPVGFMSDDHITRCIWAIRKGEAWENGCNGFSNSEWILIFQAELIRRNRSVP